MSERIISAGEGFVSCEGKVLNSSQRKQSFFKKWSPPLRKQVAAFIRECRKRDRDEACVEVPWLSQSRNLAEYCNRLEVSKDFIEAFLGSRIHSNGQARILDVGVGKGGALSDLSGRFGDRLLLEGMALSPATFELKNYKHHVSLIEAAFLPEIHFDLIFSVRGGFAYTLNSFAAAEVVLNSLKKGGIAFLEDSRLLLSQKWFRDYLSTKGFEIEETRYESGRPVAFKIIQSEGEKLNLKVFRERYDSQVEQKSKVFLEWGFDRIRKESPVSALFQDLYSSRYYIDLITR